MQGGTRKKIDGGHATLDGVPLKLLIDGRRIFIDLEDMNRGIAQNKIKEHL